MSILKGIAIGALAGLAGSWRMTNFQTSWTRVQEGSNPPSKGDQGTPESEESATFLFALLPDPCFKLL